MITDEENESWLLYLLLRKIIVNVLSPRIIESHLLQLEEIVPECLLLYKHLFGELVYKFHNMIHMVRIIINNGPLVHYWSMRYESQHRHLKTSA